MYVYVYVYMIWVIQCMFLDLSNGYVRGLNRTAHAFLVGTKYDLFTALPPEEQEEIDSMAR